MILNGTSLEKIEKYLVNNETDLNYHIQGWSPLHSLCYYHKPAIPVYDTCQAWLECKYYGWKYYTLRLFPIIMLTCNFYRNIIIILLLLFFLQNGANINSIYHSGYKQTAFMYLS